MRTCGVLIYLFIYVCAYDNKASKPRIISLKLDSKICDKNSCKYLLNIRGGEFLGYYSWRLTPVEALEGGICDVIYPNYELKEVETTQWVTKLEILVPITDTKLYFCLYKNDVKKSPFGGKWVHQGAEYFLDTKSGNTELS